MPIALLNAISEADLPLLVDDPDELGRTHELLANGLILGFDGTMARLPCGQLVVTQPGLIRDVTRAGRQFLRGADPRMDALADLL